jgi:hypothetical protein
MKLKKPSKQFILIILFLKIFNKNQKIEHHIISKPEALKKTKIHYNSSSFIQKGVAANHRMVPINISIFILATSIVPMNESMLTNSIKTTIDKPLINFSIFII